MTMSRHGRKNPGDTSHCRALSVSELMIFGEGGHKYGYLDI